METTTHASFSQDVFDAFLESRDEPAWLLDDRRQAWQQFLDLDWPARGDEEWQRTDIRTFKLDRYAMLGDSVSADPLPSARLSENVELGGHVTAVDGRCTESNLDAKWAERGVLLGDLAEILTQSESLLQPHLLNRLVDPGYDKLAALHSACWSAGTVLYVPRGVAIDEPLHAFSVLSDGGTDIGRTLVVLEEGATATLLCETASPSESAGGFHCGSLELFLQPGSHLRFVTMQNWGQGVWHFSHEKARLGRDASMQWTVAAMGSRLAKVNQHVALAGRGANCQVNGVMFTEGKQHLAYNTLQHHVAPSCQSDFLYKGALQDKSRTVWRGMIKVDPKAQKTDGYQRNDNLLLSGNVRADSIPGLEIEADDVRCSHGSTSGRVDEELIFYAQCRGFTRKEAIRAIVTGFFQKIFDRITIDSVREALAHAIATRVRDYE